jgi:peptide deformylase
MELPAIVQAGDPVLRSAARLVRDEELGSAELRAQLGSAELRALVDTMVAVMRVAPGVGLAAPQIGVGLQVFVAEDDDARMARLRDDERIARGRISLPLVAIVNPVLEIVSEEPAVFFEGCLSVKGWAALVPRARVVEVRGVDPEGRPIAVRAEGWPARIFQHEIDHLRGTLYVDKMISRSFCTSDQLQGRWAGRSVDEIARALGLTLP